MTSLAIEATAPARTPVAVAAGFVLGAAAAAAAIVGASDGSDALANACAAIVIVWAVLTAFLAMRGGQRLFVFTGLASVAGGLALVSDRYAALVPYALCMVAIALPDGRAATRRHSKIALVVATLTALPFVAIVGVSDDPAFGPVAIEAAALACIALVAYVMSCRGASVLDRARLQWAGWGAVVSASLALAALLMHQLVRWPDALGAPVVVATVFVPIALGFASFDALALRIDRLLVRTIEVGGLIVLVGIVYVVVVLGFGETPNDAGRRVLGLSMIAAAIAALLFVPARNWLEEIANRRVYGDRQAPDEPLQTFGARMSRAIPLEELLLQLAESLKKSMQLAAAEVWTGTGGLFERAASVPFRETERIRLREEEIAVVARAHVSGNAWIQVWLPAFLDEHPGQTLRVAPLVHSGDLLGVVVCARNADQHPFTEDEERVLTELARQVALALHNSALDTALQASLDDLRVANEQLQASRARIVAASDQSRRQIERNLHDGAQQHLVALAVKLGLARQIVDSDAAAAAALLEELRGDAQETLTQLRELAHGIYPPLLMDRGLREALVAAANRSVLPAEVDADVGRYPPDAEAAVYFCCLEAMQNAGKYAGEGAHVTITVTETDHMLRFTVADDGAGFDLGDGAVKGHGFVNMADRLGAISGSLDVDSAPGRGTSVSGEIPLAVHAFEDRPSQS